MYPIMVVGGLLIAGIGALLPNPKEKKTAAPAPTPAAPVEPVAPARPSPTDPLPSPAA